MWSFPWRGTGRCFQIFFYLHTENWGRWTHFDYRIFFGDGLVETTQVRFESIVFYLKTQHDFSDFSENWCLDCPPPWCRRPANANSENSSPGFGFPPKNGLKILKAIHRCKIHRSFVDQIFLILKKDWTSRFWDPVTLGSLPCVFFSTRKVMPEKSRLLCSIGFFLRWKSWSLKWSERRSKNIARRSSLSRIAWFERWRSWRSPSLTLPSVSTWPFFPKGEDFVFTPKISPT